jgi:hypothetical protein
VYVTLEWIFGPLFQFTYLAPQELDDVSLIIDGICLHRDNALE